MIKINYRIEGKGDRNLFLIHGWAADKSIWHNQVQEFSKDCRVISVDLRGHGESNWEDTDNLLKSFAADVLEVCQELELKKVTQNVWSIVGPLTNRTKENLGNNATFGFVVTDEGIVHCDEMYNTMM